MLQELLQRDEAKRAGKVRERDGVSGRAREADAIAVGRPNPGGVRSRHGVVVFASLSDLNTKQGRF
eukprot:3692298-Prymnesium_polylepis.1